MWLSRSGCSPLSLDFDESAIHPDDVTDALSMLLPHRARWQNSHLNLSRARLPMIDGPLPLLRSLHLSLAHIGSVPPNVTFRDVPLLRTVVLNDTAVASLTLPWAQLTSLTLHWLTPHECLPILQHATGLVHCDLGIADSGDAESIPDIALPSLHSLALYGYSFAGYLGRLIVPALRNLRISESFLEPNCIDTLATFVAKSQCKLQDLCIVERVVESEHSYREAFPSMKVSFED